MLKTVNMQFTAGAYEFTQENIEKFITPNFARTKIGTHIKRLRNFLISNEYQFGSAITVVKTNSGKFLVIDGNHRIGAFRDLLNSGQTKSILSVVIEYPTMSIDSMKEFMKILGTNVKRHNCDSLFEVYEKDIFVYQNSDKLPVKVSIRNRKGCFRLINLINFLEVKDDAKMKFQNFLDKTVDRAIESSEKDLEFLRSYLLFFEEIFGKVSSENRYAVPCFMISLASIYGYNYEKIIKNLSISKQRFQNLIQDPEILELLAIGGKARQMLHAVRDRQIKVLNRKLLKDQELFE